MQKKIKVSLYLIIFLVLAIVGTKCDRVKEYQVNVEEAKEFAKKNKCLFALTSSKQDEGIEGLLLELALAYNKKLNGLPYIEGDIPDNENIQKQNNITLTNPIKKKDGCCTKTKENNNFHK